MSQPPQSTLNDTRDPSSEPTSGDVVEWQCPYCEQTRQTPHEIRDHITTSTTGDHMGTTGWSAPDDIIGYDANKNIARVIEGFTPTTTPQDAQQERGWKKKQVVNAWLARPPHADVDAVKHAIDNRDDNHDSISRQYVYKLLRDLHNDEFAEGEIVDLRDTDLETELGEKIDTFHKQSTQITMSAENQTEKETDAQTEDNKISVPRGEGVTYFYNALLMAPDIDYKVLPKVLSTGKEYARRELKKVRDGTVSASEVEAEFDEYIQQEMMDALQMIGELDGLNAEISDTYEPPEQTSTPDAQDEQWPDLGERSKTVIVNSYLLAEKLGEELSPTTVSNAAQCGYEYARRTLNELANGDISQHEISEEESSQLQTTLHELYAQRGYLPAVDSITVEPSEQSQAELEHVVAEGGNVVTDFETTADGTATDCIFITPDSEERCTISAQDESHFCHMHQPDIDIADEATSETPDTDAAMETSDPDLPTVPGSKRDALLNLHTMNVDLINEESGNVVDSSAEYARQKFNKIDRNEITQTDIDAAQDTETQSVLRERLEKLGYTTAEAEPTEPAVEETVSWDDATTDAESASTSDTKPPATPAVAEQTTPGDTTESLAEVAHELSRIQDKADTFLRQAQFEGDGQPTSAEFIAQELNDELEELIEKIN